MAQRLFLTRRDLLRGVGVALALPWLESVSAWGAESPAIVPAKRPRQRFVCLYMANGVNAGKWSAKGQGAAMELSKTLAPLAGFREDLNVVQGLYNPNALKGEQHIAAAPIILSGGPAINGEMRAATSFDQVLAKRMGNDREFASLVLGVEAPNLGTHGGWPLLFSGHISWSGPTSPIPRENNPRSLYDRLVGDPHAAREAGSVLDLVADDTTALLKRVSNLDRQRMDQYLTQVREIEQRLARPVPVATGPTVAKLMPKPPEAQGLTTDASTRLMIDLIAIALESGKTDVATLMFQNDLSQMDVSFAGSSPLLRDHHGLSHAGGEQYQLVNQYYIDRYAQLLTRLKSVRDGDGTLLDNSCVLFCSSLMEGGSHDRSRLPIVLAGKAGGRIKTGRTFDFQGKDKPAVGDDGRRLCNLYASLLGHYGVEGDSFGDSTGRLAGF